MNPAGEGYKLLSRRPQSCSWDPDEFGMSSLTANVISDLCVFQTLGSQKQMDKLRASCWPRLCAQRAHRNFLFLLHAGWPCMRDPPRFWAFNGVETLSEGWLRDWEHLIEGTSPNRKKEASLLGKKKREQCLLHVPDNGAIIMITVRASWPFGGPEWRVIMCTIEAGCLCPTACEFWAMFFFFYRFVSEPARCIQFPAPPRTYYINFNSPNFV